MVLPGESRSWMRLEWCHVEGCPKLHTLFPAHEHEFFESIRIFFASDLPMAYCIWVRSICHHSSSFEGLQYIYLHNCPQLVFILPISSFTLPHLESIQIAHCSNLQHIFPLNDECPQEIASKVTFKKLKHIKLYHLHKLEQICDTRLITASALETISLRDCWGLRRLPAVSLEGPKPVVDWVCFLQQAIPDVDMLHWIGLD
ncbi:unnamed protein product [Triticum turgidum subsp. durum]|uniref:Disease resistance protein At4g27190-like leucine-rich repeats domain-containing protein n=1 Tax=Triticum turgidum subsp. durum TaxID=4567 RepID=A0A9R0S3R3_TRITD|nr:unnamed protein product [Triticum turgidum subsp. durum]